MILKYINRSEKGFTFIELILVVLLISILSTIALLNYSDLQKQTTNDLVWADLKVFRAAVRAYYLKYQSFPGSLSVLLNVKSNYLDEMPKDKFAPTNDYSYHVDTATNQCKIWSRGPNGMDESGAGDDLTLSFGP